MLQKKIVVFIATCMLFSHVAFADIKRDFDSGAAVEVIIQNAIDEGVSIESVVSQLVALSPEQVSQIVAVATRLAPDSVAEMVTAAIIVVLDHAAEMVAAAGTLPVALQLGIVAHVDLPNGGGGGVATGA